MRTIGDAAAVFKPMCKTYQDVGEAIADAQNGEFERMRELGIRASQSANQVMLYYSKNGKDLSLKTTKNASDIRKAILSIFDQKYGGAGDKLAAAWEGLLGNLRDKGKNFKLMIARAGVFDWEIG